jgi:GT2 family glycosyltransferase
VPDPTRLERETTNEQPLVSVIIPHYLGDVVSRCLHSIARAPSAVSFEVIVVDDQPHDDGSLSRARAAFPALRVAKTHGRHGFGTACNAGLAVARGKYLALLNNDAVVAQGWLEPLVDAAERDPGVGVLQAKIRSLQHPERFDYSGAAGGLMDWLGFPFALGRVFDAIEKDHGQYDRPRDIFWAVGCALFIRRSALEVTGGFDESFYMHMEEIDLCWRMHAAGFRVRSCPASVIYHENGHSLKQGSFKKAYLNHRNNLVLLLKNMPWSRLVWVLPVRLILIGAVAVLGIMRRDLLQPLAAVLGAAWVLVHTVGILRRRRLSRAARTVPDAAVLDQLQPSAIVIDHFVRRTMTAAQLLAPTEREARRTAPAMRGIPKHA